MFTNTSTKIQSSSTAGSDSTSSDSTSEMPTGLLGAIFRLALIEAVLGGGGSSDSSPKPEWLGAKEDKPVVVDDKIATWREHKNLLVFAKGVSKEDIIRFEVVFTKSGPTIPALFWQPMIGCASVPWELPVTNPLGQDAGSVAYYKQGYVIQGGQRVTGLQTWADGNTLGMEADFKKRQLYFFVNGKRQPVYFTDIPDELQFGVGAGSKDCKAQLIKYEKVDTSSFKAESGDKPVKWHESEELTKESEAAGASKTDDNTSMFLTLKTGDVKLDKSTAT
ncbi:MAG: hypothetical protein EZS28_015971, partial [Streblomastix strix]